ncbi:MAG: hypothetical protein ACP5N3_05125 [Candidatus Nanoarchaeia archaeon]
MTVLIRTDQGYYEPETSEKPYIKFFNQYSNNSSKNIATILSCGNSAIPEDIYIKSLKNNSLKPQIVYINVENEKLSAQMCVVEDKKMFEKMFSYLPYIRSKKIKKLNSINTN